MAWILIFLNALVGLWALCAHWLDNLRIKHLWILTAVAHIGLFVQAIVGVIIYQNKADSVDQFHLFYGFLALATVGFLYAYRDQLKEYIYLLYGFGSLFLMGLAIRATQIPAILN